MPHEEPTPPPNTIPGAFMELYMLGILISDPVNGPPLYNKLLASEYSWNLERKRNKTDLEVQTAELASAVNEFYANTNTPIGFQIIKDVFSAAKDDSLLRITLNEIEKRAEDARNNAAAVVAQVDRHVRLQKSRLLADQYKAATDLGRLEEADEVLSSIQNSVPQARQRAIIEMADPLQAFAFMDEEEDECSRMQIPIQCFMDKNVTLRRKRVLTFIAKYYGGKSTFIRDCLFLNLQRHRCLLYSLETGDRPNAGFLMRAFRLTRDPARAGHPDLTPVRLAQLTQRDGYMGLSHRIETVDCLHNQRARIIPQLAETFRNLTIVMVPPGVLTMAMVKQDLEKGIREGRPYGIVAVDYLDKCKMKIKEAADKRLETIRVTQEFQVLCNDYDVAGITGSQLNAEGIRSNNPTAANANETIDKAMMGDDMIVSSQDPDGERDGIVKLLLDKTRGRKGKYSALVATGWDIGQYCVQDVLLDAEQPLRREGDTVDSDPAVVMFRAGQTVQQVMEALNISQATAYRRRAEAGIMDEQNRSTRTM